MFSLRPSLVFCLPAAQLSSGERSTAAAHKQSVAVLSDACVARPWSRGRPAASSAAAPPQPSRGTIVLGGGLAASFAAAGPAAPHVVAPRGGPRRLVPQRAASGLLLREDVPSAGRRASRPAAVPAALPRPRTRPRSALRAPPGGPLPLPRCPTSFLSFGTVESKVKSRCAISTIILQFPQCVKSVICDFKFLKFKISSVAGSKRQKTQYGTYGPREKLNRPRKRTVTWRATGDWCGRCADAEDITVERHRDASAWETLHRG